MERPFVSIIIPYFKSYKTIFRAVESVVNQSDSNWELLVVDDGSRDNLEEELAQIHCEGVRIFRKENAGPSATRNFGAEQANGHFVAFLDSDDWLSSNWLQKFRQIYEHKSFDIAYCFGALVDEVSGEKVEWHHFQSFYFNGEKIEFNNLVGSFLVSKQLFLKTGGFDSSLRYGENMDLAIQLLDRDPVPVQAFLPEELVYFGNSTNTKIRNGKYGRSLLLRDLRYFQQKNLSFLVKNKSFLRSLIRRQLVCATVCWEVKIYVERLIELYRYSGKDAFIYTLLLFVFPINHLRLKYLGFRK